MTGKKTGLVEAVIPALFVGKGLWREFLVELLWKLRFRAFGFSAFILPDFLKIYLVAGVFWALGIESPG